MIKSNKKLINGLLILLLCIAAAAVLLLPAIIGGAHIHPHGAAMSAGHILSSIKIDSYEFLKSDQPIDSCTFHWIIFGALVLYIILFVWAGTKCRRKTCTFLLALFVLATLSFTYFMECMVCLALIIICLVVIVVTFIVRILIGRMMSKGSVSKVNNAMRAGERGQDNRIEDANTYTPVKSGGYEGDLVFLKADKNDDAEDEDLDQGEMVEIIGGGSTVSTTRTIRKITTITTTMNEGEDRERLERLERERLENERRDIERERLEKDRLERENIEKERRELDRERKLMEQQRAESERLESERKALERERRELDEQRRANEREREKLEQERKEEERKEQQRLQHEKTEEERIAREAAEKKEAARWLAELDEAEAKKAEDERKVKRALEIAAENARIETERAFYASGAARAPTFKLSREDVLDRVDDMAENLYDYPVITNTRLRSNDKSPDSLRAGVWTFAVMYESKVGVIKFFARMDKRYAQKLAKDHPTITVSGFAGGEDWYKVIIDNTYYSKREVFSMIDNWYAYVATRYYSFDAINKKHMTDETAAALAESTVVARIMKEILQPDPDMDKAERELVAAEALMLSGMRVVLAKEEIAKAAEARFGDKVEISRRPSLTRTNLPLADTYYTQGISDKGVEKRVCYAYVYQLKNNSVKIIVKLPRVYAEKQAEVHTNMCRSRFPAGKGWYVTILDSTYKSENEVYTILARAKSFVESTEDRDIGE